MSSENKRKSVTDAETLLNEMVNFGQDDSSALQSQEFNERIAKLIKDLEVLNHRIDKLNQNQSF